MGFCFEKWMEDWKPLLFFFFFFFPFKRKQIREIAYYGFYPMQAVFCQKQQFMVLIFGSLIYIQAKAGKVVYTELPLIKIILIVENK